MKISVCFFVLLSGLAELALAQGDPDHQTLLINSSLPTSHSIGRATVEQDSTIKPSRVPPPDEMELTVSPYVVKMVEPVYPEEALKKGVEGKVWVKIWVTSQGEINDVVVLKSDSPVFASAAVNAAWKFKFTPGYKDSLPVDVWVSVPFKFKLGPEAPIIKRNAEELPKKLKTPTVLVITGPKSLEKSIAYPSDAAQKRIEGAVYATVTLNEQRRIKELKIKKGIGGGCDEEVLSALASHKFHEDKKLELVKYSEEPTISVVVQFILPSK